MTRRTKAEWQSLIAAQKKCGLSAAAFCRERGIPVNYFCRVRRQFQLDEAEKPVAGFIPVSVSRSGASENITVRHEGGASVELPFSISPTWVAQLLVALQD
tara:strand:- start:947 stop:1249 length:303 start_codon:yes stop_codon:yes gene_type:complete